MSQSQGTADGGQTTLTGVVEHKPTNLLVGSKGRNGNLLIDSEFDYFVSMDFELLNEP